MDSSNLIWFFLIGFGITYILKRIFVGLEVSTLEQQRIEAEARRQKKIDELYGRISSEKNK